MRSFYKALDYISILVIFLSLVYGINIFLIKVDIKNLEFIILLSSVTFLTVYLINKGINILFKHLHKRLNKSHLNSESKYVKYESEDISDFINYLRLIDLNECKIDKLETFLESTNTVEKILNYIFNKSEKDFKRNITFGIYTPTYTPITFKYNLFLLNIKDSFRKVDTYKINKFEFVSFDNNGKEDLYNVYFKKRNFTEKDMAYAINNPDEIVSKCSKIYYEDYNENKIDNLIEKIKTDNEIN